MVSHHALKGPASLSRFPRHPQPDPGIWTEWGALGATHYFKYLIWILISIPFYSCKASTTGKNIMYFAGSEVAESGFEPIGDLEPRFQTLLCSLPPPLLSKKWGLSNQKQYIQCMRNAPSESHVWSLGRGLPATPAARSAPVTNLRDCSVSAFLPALLAAIILTFFQQLWGKKKISVLLT